MVTLDQIVRTRTESEATFAAMVLSEVAARLACSETFWTRVPLATNEGQHDSQAGGPVASTGATCPMFKSLFTFM